jgi:hypothetical protein
MFVRTDLKGMTMLSRTVSILLLTVLSAACATSTASLKTYSDPSIHGGGIEAVAVLPMRNARLMADESRELNRSFTQALTIQNPSLVVLGPAEAVDAMNRANLAERYSDFLRNYAASGVPDARVLQQMGAALNVDAIFQGEVFDIREQDGVYGGDRGETQVTVRYALLGTSGTVLWEATSRGVRTNATTIGKAPPQYEAIALAQEKIVSSLPLLGGGQR